MEGLRSRLLQRLLSEHQPLAPWRHPRSCGVGGVLVRMERPTCTLRPQHGRGVGGQQGDHSLRNQEHCEAFDVSGIEIRKGLMSSGRRPQRVARTPPETWPWAGGGAPLSAPGLPGLHSAPLRLLEAFPESQSSLRSDGLLGAPLLFAVKTRHHLFRCGFVVWFYYSSYIKLGRAAEWFLLPQTRTSCSHGRL